MKHRWITVAQLMRRLGVLCCLLLLLLTASAQVHVSKVTTSPPASHRIDEVIRPNAGPVVFVEGMVTDSLSMPLRGAVIWYGLWPDKKVVTNEDGQFYLRFQSTSYGYGELPPTSLGYIRHGAQTWPLTLPTAAYFKPQVYRVPTKQHP